MMRLQRMQDLDVQSLEARGHWASMEELLEVVCFHLPRYDQTVKTCQNDPGQVNPSDLTFATKFWGHLLVHQGEKIASHDLSIYHS